MLRSEYIVCVATSCLAILGCGPGSTVEGDGTNGMSSSGGSETTGAYVDGLDAATTLGVSSTSDTEDMFDCPGARWHQGSLFVDDSVDVEALRDVGGVTGDLVVAETSTLLDLEFLSCLQEVGRNVWIYDNSNLVGLHGLERLALIGDASMVDSGSAIHVLRNEALEDMSALELVQDLRTMDISSNANLVNIGLPNLHGVEEFYLGFCDEELIGHPANNAALMNIGGYPSLEHVGRLSVEGQGKITSLESLVAMAENGVVFDSAEFQRNINLPTTEIEAFAAAAGTAVEFCENHDDGKACAPCPSG